MLKTYTLCCLLACVALNAADVPRHVIPLSEAGKTDRRSASDIAHAFTRDTGVAFDSLYIAKQYVTQHNGVTHTVYQQQFQGLDVYGAEWVVNVDAQGQVLNAGGKLFDPPARGMAAASTKSLRRAAGIALNARNPGLAEASLTEVPLGPRMVGPRIANLTTHFRAGASQRAEVEGRAVWYPVRGHLEPAWLFYVLDEDQIEAEQIVVAGGADIILARQSMTWYQAPRGLVYTGSSPQPTPHPGTKLEGEPPYVQRELVSFAGDPIASPRGWLTGNTTSGNNAVTGINPLGIPYLEPILTTSPTLDFQFPLELGTGAPNPAQFRDAAATNLFYWMNRMHDFFYSIGFDEAAGNYQQDNFGRGGAGGDPLYAYVHYGSQASGSALLNNAFYLDRGLTDGSRAMIGMYLGSSPGRWADGAYSNETIIHEYTHGVSVRLMRDLDGHQGGAMGEAFSDFFALEFLTPEGAPPDGIYPVGEYLFNAFGVGIRSRPYSTNMDVNPLTYRDLGRAANFVSIHHDGGIWMMSLWEMRANLIAQFGEREGRRRLRLNVIDGMKLSPPAASMVDARDAILLADRVNFRGESQSQIWAAFAKRGLGTLAYSRSSDTIVVDASYEKPSTAGVLAFSTDNASAGEPLLIRLFDQNLTSEAVQVQVTSSSGDLETISLRRQGSLWTGTLFTTAGPTANENGELSLIAGDAITAYYTDSDTGTGVRQITRTINANPGYGTVTITGLRYEFPAERPLNLRRTANFAAAVRLPFEFPFYDQKVNTVTVGVNGSILFDTAQAPACYDRPSAATRMGVSPMWAWIRTDGTAQPGEDIYVSQAGEDAITFRWVAETAPLLTGVFGFAPEPVNFATTLYRDGRIRFQYGETGNVNVVNSQPFLNCEPGLPVVGISRGNGSAGRFPVAHFGRANFRNAPSVEFRPPFGHSSLPEVVMETPTAGAVAPGLLEVRGIASDSQSTVAAVNILIDGTYRARAATSLTRPDYCASNPLPGCPNVGFAATLDLAGLGIATGTHTLQLRVVNGRGAWTDTPPVSFTAASAEATLPVGRIESPAMGATIQGTQAIVGYAYGRGATRVNFVEVLVDDIVHGRAIYNAPRPDICAAEANGSPNCPAVGFRFDLNTALGIPTIVNGEHQLRIRLLDATGRITALPAQTIIVDNAANQAPLGTMTAPVNGARVSGTIRISGYGYDPDGRVAQVLLLVNGTNRATIRYGLPQPEVCAGLPNIAACPNIGFEADFDTKAIPNGLHRIGVMLVDDRGAQVTVPRTTNAGVNVFVEN